MTNALRPQEQVMYNPPGFSLFWWQILRSSDRYVCQAGSSNMIRSLVIRASAALASAAMASVVSVAFIAAPSYAANIHLSDSNCDSFTLTGSPPDQVLTCVVSNAPTGCTIVGPTSGTINVPITLTAQCATGSPSAWTWSGGNCANVTTQSCSAVSSSATQITYS